MFVLILAFILLFNSCTTRFVVPPEAKLILATQQALALANPGLPGPYRVASFRYGSAENPRRSEYSPELVTVQTPRLDIANFTDAVDYAFWGYDAHSVPQNGIVWYPEGAGPFPVVVAVHGNASANLPSEFGYAYLGELLASRGIIFVSVDQTFLNGESKGETAARAYHLLSQLQTLLAWNEERGNPLFGLMDTGRLALLGHSRGGYAAMIAAYFNRQAADPEDPAFAFSFDLPIRAVIALAPTEGSYRPANHPVAVNDVNILVLHGAHDGDVYHNKGLNFLQRTYPGPGLIFSSWWIYGADHSRFNTVWDNYGDPRPAFGRALLAAGEQRWAAQVLVGAFLDYAFGREARYEQLFLDYRTALPWLPETYYRASYASGSEERIVDFEPSYGAERFDQAEWRVATEDFDQCDERMLEETDYIRYRENQILALAWGYESETAGHSLAQTVEPELELSAQSGQGADEADYLAFDVVALELADPHLDLTIEVSDGTTTHDFLLSDYSIVTEEPPVLVGLLPAYDRLQPQSVYIPFGESIRVQALTFVFNQTRSGTLALDNIRLGTLR